VKELEEFLQSHANQFRVDRKVALRQIYLNPDKHADTLEQDVQELLAELDANSNPGQYGDSFLLPVVFELTPVRQLTQMFGGEFGQNVYAQETGTWSGPITSGYGVHLVFVEEKEEGLLPPLEEIRPVVEREWFAQKRSEAKRQFFEKLRERYEIIIELPEEDPQAAETSS
jgi:hypothetical protein